ncbi:MAG: response regulator [Elusimicrobiota bacterium]
MGKNETAEERPTILVVDDDPVYRAICRARLAKHFDVVTASGGEEAILHLSERRPAAVLLDMCMPRVSGADVLEYMNLFPAMRGVPVIVVSASSIRGDIKKRLAGLSNLLDCVDKPRAVGRLVEVGMRAVMIGRLHQNTPKLLRGIRGAQEVLRHAEQAAEAVDRR